MMTDKEEINRRLAAMLLSISDQLSLELENADPDVRAEIESFGLSSEDVELLEEGDTTDIEKLARISAALRVRITIDPDFSAEVVPARHEIRLAAHKALHEPSTKSTASVVRLTFEGRSVSTGTKGQQTHQTAPAYAD